MKYYCQWDGWRNTPCVHGVCAEAGYKKPTEGVDYPEYVQKKMNGEIDA